MTRRTVAAVVLAVAPVLSAGTTPAAAQGNRGAPPGQSRKLEPKGPKPTTPVEVPGGEPGTPPVTATEPRTFGLWLDDATLASPGSIWITAAATRWSAPAGSGVDVPSIGIAAGLTTRAQLSFAAPYSRVSSGDARSSGLGDVYAGVKMLLASPATHRIGLSLAPTLELLGTATSGGRAHAVLPLSAETGRGRTRLYGSTGVFSRGAVFLSGAVEQHLSDRLSLTGALMQSWSTADATATGAIGLGRTRTDLGGSVTTFITGAAALFATASRTISHQEFDSSRYVVSGGIAFVLTPPAVTPVRPPK